MTSGPTPASPLDDLLAHREWIKRLALRLARDEHAADDLMQDAWLAALSHPPRQGGVRAWFRKVVRHRAYNVHRDDERRETREQRRGPQPPVRSTAESVAEADAHRHVVDAVMDLGEPYRTTLVLRYFEQLSVEEVARRTDVPLETARARLRRGRARLRERLDGEFGSRAAWCVPLLDGWPGLPEGTTGVSAAGALAATLLGGLIVNKMLIGGAAVIALVAAGLWFSQDVDTEAPKPVDEQAVEVADDPRVGEREHVAVESPVATEPEATTESADAAEDPVEAFRRMIDALPHRKITGVVVDMDGRPIGGASVMVGNEDGPNGPRQATTAIAEAAAGGGSVDIADPESPAQRIARYVAERYGVQAGADGTFEMEIPIRAEMPSPAAEIHVWAYAEDHAGAGALVADDVDHVELRLSPSVTLRVRLLDGAGMPIEGRSIIVNTEFSSGQSTLTTPTDAAGWGVATGLAAGSIVRVRTKSETRVSGLSEIVRLPEHGIAEVVLRDDGLRRVRITAIVSDPDIPVSGFYVRSQNGGSEIRAWPGGREAVVELPDKGVRIGLSTAVGPSEMVDVPDDADEIELRMVVPLYRWIDVEIGDRDPRYMSFSGMARGELAYAANLAGMATDGVLRLPIVEGGEYALQEMHGNRYRLIGSVGSEGIDLAGPQHTVTVRVVPAGGGVLPPGTTLTATPGARGVRNAQAIVEGAVTANGDVPLALVPGITYALVVAAPDMASVRVEHRPGAEGGEVPVTLQAGKPLQIAIEGIADGSRTSVVTFPDFGRVESKVEDGAVVVEGVRDGWVLVMAASRVLLVNADGAEPRSAPAGATFAPSASATTSGEKRVFLVGATPLSNGVYPVALVGAPFGIPEGRYVPVEWTREEIIVHAPVHLSADAPTWTRPADDDVEWSRGEHTGDAAAHAVIAADGDRLPVGALGQGKASRWRTSGPDVTVEPVEPR